jgi:nucleoside-diphosphate-sugar epimerase
MDIDKSTPILVTGASGFISLHVIKLLLQSGYKVRGTVRSLQDTKKVQLLRNLVPERLENLELVEADLQKKETWDSVVKGCKYILHLASPVLIEADRSEDEVIRPAVEGTLNVLEAAVQNDVQKVVLTSSIVTMWDAKSSKPLDESIWADEITGSPYEKGKIRAEKAAWDFWRKNSGKFELTTILPSIVTGPILGNDGGVGEMIIKPLILGAFPEGVPDMAFPFVDVRDVALAHLKALENPESNGQRYIISSEVFSFKQFADALHEEFSKYGYTIPTNVLSDTELQEKAKTNPVIQFILPYDGKAPEYDTSKSVNELGLNYILVKDAAVAMISDSIRLGNVPNKIQA